MLQLQKKGRVFWANLDRRCSCRKGGTADIILYTCLYHYLYPLYLYRICIFLGFSAMPGFRIFCKDPGASRSLASLAPMKSENKTDVADLGFRLLR